MKEYQKEYYVNNKGLIKECQKQYRKNNPLTEDKKQKMKEYQKIYLEAKKINNKNALSA